MAEQNRNMTDEALSQQLRRSRGGKWGGKLLSLLGVVIAVAGILLGGNLVLIVVGGIGFLNGVAEDQLTDDTPWRRISQALSSKTYR